MLLSVDGVDELFSELLYMPPVLILTPDHRVWDVWVDMDREALTSDRSPSIAAVALNAQAGSGQR